MQAKKFLPPVIRSCGHDSCQPNWIFHEKGAAPGRGSPAEIFAVPAISRAAKSSNALFLLNATLAAENSSLPRYPPQ
jgi:hypothetical protein